MNYEFLISKTLVSNQNLAYFSVNLHSKFFHSKQPQTKVLLTFSTNFRSRYIGRLLVVWHPDIRASHHDNALLRPGRHAGVRKDPGGHRKGQVLPQSQEAR